MPNLFKKLFGGSDKSGKAGKEEPATEYAGFHISPCPQQRGGGWSTQAVIRKEVDGVMREHAFIRADTSPTKEGAIALCIAKAKVLIDQRGENIFA